MARILIKHVNIIDGTGQPAFHGHVLVKDDRITHVVKEIPVDASEVDEVIDGKGHVLSPGFIDSHSHSDLMIFKQMILKPKIHQGITTEILGQDGISVAPLPGQYVTQWRQNLSGLDGSHESFNWNFGDLKGYLTCIDNTDLTSNVSYLVPHGNVRMSVMGLDDRPATPLELILMKETVRDAMEIGCPGMSAGLIYTPGAYADTYEITELCKVVAEYDGVFVVHQRSEAGNIIESMEELMAITRASNVRLHISHFKLCGKKNWHLMDEVLNMIDEGLKEGLKITFDMYPYIAGSTMLSAILPPWVQDGGVEKMMERLSNQEVCHRIIEEIQSENCPWDNFIEFAGCEGIYITDVGSEKNQWMVGKHLVEISSQMETTPLEAAFKVLVEEKNHVSMVDFYGKEAHLEQLIQRGEGVVSTDGLLGGKAHPRVYGAFPKVIDRFVNKNPLITLEQAIRKMTGLPAEIFGLEKRGLIKEGYYADLIIFDALNFKDTNSYEQPHSYPQGLKLVMVNGQEVYDDEAWHLVPCGQLLLKKIQ